LSHGRSAPGSGPAACGNSRWDSVLKWKLLALGLILAAAAVAGRFGPESSATGPTATVKVCHLCDEELPGLNALVPTPTSTCDECSLGATRAANAATVIAGQRPTPGSEGGGQAACVTGAGGIVLLASAGAGRNAGRRRRC